MATAARPKPTDATGIARAKAAKKNEAEVKARQDEITTTHAKQAAQLTDEILDARIDAPVAEPEQVTDGRIEAASPAPVVPEPEEIVVAAVGLADDSVVIRTIADIERMTWGYGNEYSFVAGQKYRVPKDLAGHLESLGYLYLM